MSNDKEPHEHIYSRSMNQPYPRACTICGQIESTESLPTSEQLPHRIFFEGTEMKNLMKMYREEKCSWGYYVEQLNVIAARWLTPIYTRQQAEIEELKKRLTLDKPNPFPDTYDAIDLLNDRNKILQAELTALKESGKNETAEFGKWIFTEKFTRFTDGIFGAWQHPVTRALYTTDELYDLYQSQKQKT